MPGARRIPRPVRAARNAAQRLHATLAGVEQLKADVARLGEAVERLSSQTHHESQFLLDAARADHAETLALLQLLRDDEPGNRRRLWALRDTPGYALAFEEAEPLVTVAIATYTNVEALMERALPSVLSQTYERIEVVVVGDAAAPGIERAVRGLRDPRVRFHNQTLRGPYGEHPDGLWYVAGGPPSNEALRLARGRWIASMDDDDASTPDRVALLLAAARERSLEFCYGRIRMHRAGEPERIVGDFPPALAAVGLQASLMHTGLRFIGAELGDALFHIPGDWSRVRRMMRIGVRMGMIDDVVVDYFPGPGR